MKIYKLETLSDCASVSEAAWYRETYPTCYVRALVNGSGKPTGDYQVTMRGTFLREDILTDKQVAKLLPAWAKPDFGPRNIGAKVTAFYAANANVVTGLHESGFIVGSDEYADWLETQPDPFRGTMMYRQSLGELRA